MNLSDYAKEGFILQQQGHFIEAIRIYDEILKRDSSLNKLWYLKGVSHYNLANSHKQKLNFEQSIQHYKASIKAHPQLPQAHHNLAGVYKLKGLLEQSILSYQQALKLNSEYESAHLNLGHIYLENKQYNLALEHYTKAHQLKPATPLALFYLGITHQEIGSFELAKKYYKQAFDIDKSACFLIKQALMCPIIYQTSQQIDSLRQKTLNQLQELLDHDFPTFNPLLSGATHYYQAYQGFNDKQLNQLIAKVYLKYCPDLDYQIKSLPNKKDKIKIGFISRYLNHHSVGLGFGELIKFLSRDDFSLTSFFFPQTEDALSASFRKSSDHVINLPLHLKGAQQLIAQQELDFLFYLDIGMEPLTYFLAFSRLAPIQIVLGGHPITTGIPNIDHFMSYQLLESDDAQKHYNEKLLLLQNFLGYFSLPDIKKTASPLDLPEGHLYLCPQSLYKLHPKFDTVIKGILEKDPQGYILLFKGKHDFWHTDLNKRFHKHMPETSNRIIFLPHLPFQDFLNLIQHCDVGLDTFPFGGGTTSYMMLFYGLPVVTFPTQYHRGRVTLAYYKDIEMMDYVASNLDEYVKIALNIVLNKSEQQQTAKTIQDKIRSRNNRTAIEEIEKYIKGLYHELHLQPGK